MNENVIDFFVPIQVKGGEIRAKYPKLEDKLSKSVFAAAFKMEYPHQDILPGTVIDIPKNVTEILKNEVNHVFEELTEYADFNPVKITISIEDFNVKEIDIAI